MCQTAVVHIVYRKHNYCTVYAPPPDETTAPYLAGIAPFTAALQLDMGVFNVLLCAGPGLGRKWDQTDPKISPSFVTIQVNECHSGGKRLLPMSDFITFEEFKCWKVCECEILKSISRPFLWWSFQQWIIYRFISDWKDIMKTSFHMEFSTHFQLLSMINLELLLYRQLILYNTLLAVHI